ncbi:MAG: autotransporter-associated beta strand repeat-containing protein, partial [Nevskiaceae bacterium]|nr:autotransporter-associated beta strand repeat-containing protein [Nevskiaceae bacterium]
MKTRSISVFPARPSLWLCSTALVALLDLQPRLALAQTITETQTADGEDASLTLTDEQIETQGDSVYAANGGTVVIDGGSITALATVDGNGSRGLYAERGGATITATDVDILTDNTDAFFILSAPGAYADQDSIINLQGGTITTIGVNSDGIRATGGGAEVNATGVTIITHGDTSSGVEYQGNGSTQFGTGVMTLNNVNITTSGEGSYGVADSKSFFEFAPFPEYVEHFTGRLVMNGGSITTSGTWSDGLMASVDNTDFLANVTISTSGDVSNGVYGQYGPQITLENVGIRTAGFFSAGLQVFSDNADGVATKITGTGVDIGTTGQQSHGVYVNGVGNVVLSDSTINVTGEFSAAIYGRANFSEIFGSGLRSGGTVDITNSTLTSENWVGIWVTGTQFDFVNTISTLDVALTNSTLTSSHSAWLYAQSGNSTDGEPVTSDVTVRADASNLTGYAVTGSGSVTDITLSNGSMWTMTFNSNVTNLTLDAGTLRYGAADAALSTDDGSILLAAGGGAIDTNGFDIISENLFQGDGALTKIGAGTLRLDAANTYTGGTNVLGGTLQVTAASTSPKDNLSTGPVFIGGAADTPAADGTLLIATDASNAANGDFVFDNALTGSGLLQASNSGGAFSFAGDAVNSGFAGTVALSNDTFALTGDNTTALTNATLRLDSGNVTTVGPVGGGGGIGSTPLIETISGLTMNGGTLRFDDHVPANNEASDVIITTGMLDVSGPGTIQIDASDYNNMTRIIPPIENVPLLQHDDGGGTPSLLIQATNNQVTGTGGALNLVDLGGNALNTNQTIPINQGGIPVAKGTYDYRLTTSSDSINPDGLYVNFGLTQVNLLTNDADALVLKPGEDATGLATDLSAKVTGTGDLAIDADSQATGSGVVSLSNTLNDYTGTTFVRSGTLALAADNVLGQADSHTALLDLASGTAVSFNAPSIDRTQGTAQTIGELNAQTSSTLNLAGGALSIDNGGTAAGVLTGDGVLNLAGGDLVVSSDANPDFLADVNVGDGASATLSRSVASLGIEGIVTLAGTGTVNFDDVSGESAKQLASAATGNGAVNVRNGAQVTLTGDNSAFSGAFNIAPAASTAASLTVTSAQNLGAAVINNNASGTFTVNTGTDWTLSNDMNGAGRFVKSGGGTLTIDKVNAMTGSTTIDDGVLRLTASGAIGSGDVNVNGSTAVLDLAGVAQSVGNVGNSGSIHFNSTGSGDTFT